MPKQPEQRVQIRMEVTNPKAQRALVVLAKELASIAEDFAYRDDLRNAVRAANYLAKNLTYTVVSSEVEGGGE